MALRRRLTLASAAAVAVAVVLASAVTFLVVRGQLRGQVDEALEGLVPQVTLELPAPPGGGRVPLAPPGIPSERLSRRGGVALALPEPALGGPRGYAQLVSSDGEVLRSPPGESTLPVTPEARQVAAGERENFLSDMDVGGVHVRVLTAGLGPDRAIQVARPLDEVDATLSRVTLVLALVSLGGIALAAGLGHAVSRATLTPVRQLTEAAEHVARTHDLSRRIEAGGPDELGRLAESFNSMLEALDDSLRAQRQLVADASHELRTPLTSLRTNVEVLARANGLAAEDRRRLLGDVVGQLEELTLLVGNLVALAREDEPEPETEDVRLDELVGDAVERARRNSPGVKFALAIESCVVRGVPASLDRAVTNLLDNAAKWSPAGGEVEVSVSNGEVTVRDHGQGIEAADLPRVFDRFYRAAGARSMPGSGLGLAIVRRVAESHGGSVAAESAEGGGARLRLSLRSLSDSSPVLSPP
jgi:two-component system, OmpR family, sensor histidine kinase MprB